MAHEPTAAERRERYGLLLGTLFATFLFEGIAEPGRWEQVINTVLLSATLILAFWTCDPRRRLLQLVMIICAIVTATSLIGSLTDNPGGISVKVANLLVVALAPPAVVYGVIKSVRGRSQVTVEAIFGVLCLYILIGMMFASAYVLIDRADNGFFANGAAATLAHCLYFSFTTLTTIGYGDFTADNNLGHTLSVTEGLIGQIYLVTVVSVLVANLRPRN